MKPAIPTIYLTRHESTALNEGVGTKGARLRGWNDVPLDDKGKADLPKLANFFTSNPIKHVVAGDLQRHMVTGLAIAQKHGATFTPTASFRPWNNAGGAWKDRPINRSLIREMQWYVDHPDKPAPGGEGFGDAHSRTAAGFDAVSKYVMAHPNEPTAIVMSTRGIGSTMYHVFGDRSHIVGKDIVAPGGVIRLQHDGTKWNMAVLRKGLGNKPALPNARYGNGDPEVNIPAPNLGPASPAGGVKG
jgi:broad specificity phosphatase PhoE